MCYDGEAPFKAYRCFNQEQTIYDKAGSVAPSRIKFVHVEKFDINEYDKAMSGAYSEREFYFQKDKMPQKISFINGNNEEISILG